MHRVASYRNESPLCAEWAFLRMLSSFIENMTMCVMDCKAKGDFVVREHYMSSEEPSNEFASAKVFSMFLGKSVKPKCSQLALLV